MLTRRPLRKPKVCRRMLPGAALDDANLISWHFVPHDRPRLRAPHALREPGLAISRGQTSPGEDVGHAVLLRFHRVSFDDLAAAPLYVLYGRPEQPHRDAPAPERLVHEEAHHRPDRLLVDPL